MTLLKMLIGMTFGTAFIIGIFLVHDWLRRRRDRHVMKLTQEQYDEIIKNTLG